MWLHGEMVQCTFNSRRTLIVSPQHLFIQSINNAYYSLNFSLWIAFYVYSPFHAWLSLNLVTFMRSPWKRIIVDRPISRHMLALTHRLKSKITASVCSPSNPPKFPNLSHFSSNSHRQLEIGKQCMASATFHYIRRSRSPSICRLSPNAWQAHLLDWMAWHAHCVHIPNSIIIL